MDEDSGDGTTFVHSSYKESIHAYLLSIQRPTRRWRTEHTDVPWRLNHRSEKQAGIKRIQLFEWMKLLQEDTHASQEAWFLATDYVDGYLGSEHSRFSSFFREECHQGEPSEENDPYSRALALLGASALWLAHKFEDVILNEARAFSHYIPPNDDGALRKFRMTEMERDLLRVIGYGRLGSPTSLVFVNFYASTQSPHVDQTVKKNADVLAYFMQLEGTIKTRYEPALRAACAVFLSALVRIRNDCLLLRLGRTEKEGQVADLYRTAWLRALLPQNLLRSDGKKDVSDMTDNTRRACECFADVMGRVERVVEAGYRRISTTVTENDSFVILAAVNALDRDSLLCYVENGGGRVGDMAVGNDFLCL